MTGNLTISGGNFSVSGTGTFQSTVSITNDLAVDTDTLFVDVSTDRVGINAGSNPVAPLDVRGDGGIMIRSSSNNVGVGIRFSDHQTGSYAQQGRLFYQHGDASTGFGSYNEQFQFEGTETLLGFRVVGDIHASRRMGVNLTRIPDYTLEVNGTGFFQSGITIDSDNDNSGAPIYFRGSSSQRNFRIGNQIGHSNAFEITASTNNGGTSWNGTPGLLVKGDNRVSINTSSTSGTDPSNNINRNYFLNVQGDMNLNGQFFQNNEEFVTSRWTEASNQLDIYRLSKVGINQADPQYTLEVNGDINVKGKLRANGAEQWLDTYGIIKSNPNVLDEDITVPANTNAFACGDLTIANGRTVTIGSTSTFVII